MDNPYSNSGNRWSIKEDEQLLQLYNGKLNIGEICLKHKRFLGGIVCRLKSKKIISIPEDIMGYEGFIRSAQYKQMKEYKKFLNKKKNQESVNHEKGTNNDNILITIKKDDYDELKEEITELKSEMLEIKNMIKNLAIYDFD